MTDGHFLRVLGDDLRALAPLVTAAIEALDQKGTRALRYKLDGAFHVAVVAYNAAWRSSLPADGPETVVDYGRVTPLRGQGRGRARADRKPWHERAGLRLVVDNSSVDAVPRPATRLALIINDGGDHAA